MARACTAPTLPGTRAERSGDDFAGSKASAGGEPRLAVGDEHHRRRVPRIDVQVVARQRDAVTIGGARVGAAPQPQADVGERLAQRGAPRLPGNSVGVRSPSGRLRGRPAWVPRRFERQAIAFRILSYAPRHRRPSRRHRARAHGLRGALRRLVFSSIRGATMGSTRVARRSGTHVADQDPVRRRHLPEVVGEQLQAGDGHVAFEAAQHAAYWRLQVARTISSHRFRRTRAAAHPPGGQHGKRVGGDVPGELTEEAERGGPTRVASCEGHARGLVPFSRRAGRTRRV
jgi:hypothetical protein